MKINKLSLYNYKSFTGPDSHIFNFQDNKNGLYLLSGINEAEPELGANGSGKSTLWGGLFWVIFGKSPRGLKAGNIHSWYSNLHDDEPKTYGEVDFEIGKRSYRLARSWSPNSLVLTEYYDDTKSDKIITQEEVEDLISFKPDTFLGTVLVSQFGNMFFDLPPSQKMSVFSEIMNLDIWDKLSTLSGKEGRAQEEEKNEILQIIANCEGKKNTLLSQIKIIDTSAIEFLHKKTQSIEKIKIKLEKHKQAAQEATPDLTSKKVMLTKLEGKLEDDKMCAKEAVIDLDVIETIIQDLNTEKRILEGKVQGTNAKLTEIDVADDKCPMCGQSINIDHLKDEKKKLLVELNLNVRAIEAFDAQLKQEKEKQPLYIELIDELESTINSHQIDYQKIRDEIIEGDTKVALAKQELNSVQFLLNSEQEKENPFIQQRKITLEALEKVETQLPEQYDLRDQQEMLIESYKYWSKGFKELRLNLISQTLLTLEVEVNNCLIQLGMVDWSVIFDIERETKDGGISKGFSVFIISPMHNEPVPWEAWSGGESQRLRIAGAMGLANLILTQRGERSNLEVWDEPSQHLSQSGIDDLLALLHAKAENEQKQIWLVDHRSLSFGGFTKTYQVRKDSTGSHFEESFN